MRRLLSLATLAACSRGSLSNGVVEQLESLTAVPDTEDMGILQFQGQLAVDGADGDFVLTITPDDGSAAATVTLHSPGESDLRSLDGDEVSAWMPAYAYGESRSLVLTEADDVVYAADQGVDRDAVNTRLGGEVVVPGDPVGTSSDDTYDWTYRSVRIESDDGPVDLLPGEVEYVNLFDAVWRVAAIAAWDRTVRPGAVLPGCLAADSLLSYEMLRVSSAGEPEFRTRPTGEAAARVGCR